MTLDHVIVLLKTAKNVVGVVPLVGEEVGAALGMAINICEYAQEVKSNKEESKDLATHCALCATTIINNAQKGSLDEQPIHEFVIVLDNVCKSLDRRRKERGVQRWINKDKDKNELSSLRQSMEDSMKRFGLGAHLRADKAFAKLESTVEEIRARVERIHSEVQMIRERQEITLSSQENATLQLLSPVPEAQHIYAHGPHECLEATRKTVIRSILNWIRDVDTNLPIYWLSGLAGTGKTTIAKTICSTASKDVSGDLNLTAVISFFVNRKHSNRRDPLIIIRTLAYQLAYYVPEVRATVCNILRRDPQVVYRSLTELIHALITDPLREAAPKICTPILIVIDALDEAYRFHPSDDELDDWQHLLLDQLLFAFRDFPVAVKLLITSRPEANLTTKFRIIGGSHYSFKLLDISEDETRQDIEKLFSDGFRRIKNKRNHLSLDEWPSKSDMAQLIELASPLFIFVVTVINFVNSDKHNPKHRLQSVLKLQERGDSGLPFARIDDLYTEILESAVGSEKDPEVASRIRFVAAVVVLAQEPLTAATIAQFLDQDYEDTFLSLEQLSSVFILPDQLNSKDTVEVLHHSFHDFLTDSNRCKDARFYIDLRHFHGILARKCLVIMNDKLLYDICQLGDPSVSVSEFDDLKEKISSHVSPELQYASSYWAVHLRQASVTDEIIEQLQKFLLQHLLNWLELMSLRKQLSLSAELLKSLRTWCQTIGNKATSSLLISILHDAERIIAQFYEPMNSSPLHVYHTAFAVLPEAPRRRLQANFDGPTIQLLTRSENWNPTMQILWDHTGWVSCLSFSPDGSRIVTGSDDKFIRIFDVSTGALILKFRGHDSDIHSVAFSPNGAFVASGSRDRSARVWSAIDGALIADYSKHQGIVLAVAFSPDSTMIVSGSHDRTAHLWHVELGEHDEKVFLGHDKDVSCVAYSQDGLYVVTGSLDKTIRIWNPSTGRVIKTLEGHAGPVNCIAFYPHDSVLVSGSSDQTIRLWDFPSGDFLDVFESHTGPILSVAVSPDSKRIVSGSIDVTVWDIATHQIDYTLVGHTKEVCSVAFSYDGERIASGSRDETVRVWDAYLGHDLLHSTNYFLAASSPYAHSNHLYARSPDGSHFAFVLGKRTVAVLDLTTGQPYPELNEHYSDVLGVCYSEGGDHLLTWARDEGIIWNTNSTPYHVLRRVESMGELQDALQEVTSHLPSNPLQNLLANRSSLLDQRYIPNVGQDNWLRVQVPGSGLANFQKLCWLDHERYVGDRGGTTQSDVEERVAKGVLKHTRDIVTFLDTDKLLICSMSGIITVLDIASIIFRSPHTPQSTNLWSASLDSLLRAMQTQANRLLHDQRPDIPSPEVNSSNSTSDSSGSEISKDEAYDLAFTEKLAFMSRMKPRQRQRFFSAYQRYQQARKSTTLQKDASRMQKLSRFPSALHPTTKRVSWIRALWTGFQGRHLRRLCHLQRDRQRIVALSTRMNSSRALGKRKSHRVDIGQLNAACNDDSPYCHFNPQDNSLASANLSGLLSHLLQNSEQDNGLVDIFFVTFRVFATPESLLEALLAKILETWSRDDESSAIVTLMLLRQWAAHKLSDLDSELLAQISEFSQSLYVSVGGELNSMTAELSNELAQFAHTRAVTQMAGIIEAKLIEFGGNDSTAPTSPLELATALTVLQGRKFVDIRPSEWAIYIRRTFDPSWESHHELFTLDALGSTSASITKWVKKTVLTGQSVKDRVRRVRLILQTAKECYRLRNFSSTFALLAGLESYDIACLSSTWRHLPGRDRVLLNNLRWVTSQHHDYASYRRILSKSDTAIPYLNVHLQDLEEVSAVVPPSLEVDGHETINLVWCNAIAEAITHVLKYKPPASSALPGKIKLAYVEDELERIGRDPDLDEFCRNLSNVLTTCGD